MYDRLKNMLSRPVLKTKKKKTDTQQTEAQTEAQIEEETSAGTKI